MKTRIKLFILFALAVCFVLSLPAWAEYVSGYTVEFTYGDNQYVLGGGESVPLPEILDALGMSGEVMAVTVSDPSLFSASDDGGDWIVTSNKPFSSTEEMTVTLDGDKYGITVTDAEGELHYVGANGQDVKITKWFHIESRDVKDSAFNWNDNNYKEYAVTDKSVTYERRIDVKDGSNVILILCDGCTLTIKGGIHVGPKSTLSIYCQKGGTGKLIIPESAILTAGIGGNYGENCGTVKIYGGNIEITAAEDGAGIGGGYEGSGGYIYTAEQSMSYQMVRVPASAAD